MANEQNLIPGQHKLTVEELSRGGTNSAAARRRRKSMREAAEIYLSLPVSDKKAWNKISAAGIDPADIDNQMAIIVGLAKQAARGDPKAAKVLMEMLGEKPVEEQREGVTVIIDV